MRDLQVYLVGPVARRMGSGVTHILSRMSGSPDRSRGRGSTSWTAVFVSPAHRDG